MKYIDRLTELDDNLIRVRTILKLMDRQAKLKRHIHDAIASLSTEENTVLLQLLRQRKRKEER